MMMTAIVFTPRDQKEAVKDDRAVLDAAAIEKLLLQTSNMSSVVSTLTPPIPDIPDVCESPLVSPYRVLGTDLLVGEALQTPQRSPMVVDTYFENDTLQLFPTPEKVVPDPTKRRRTQTILRYAKDAPLVSELLDPRYQHLLSSEPPLSQLTQSLTPRTLSSRSPTSLPHVVKHLTSHVQTMETPSRCQPCIERWYSTRSQPNLDANSRATSDCLSEHITMWLRRHSISKFKRGFWQLNKPAAWSDDQFCKMAKSVFDIVKTGQCNVQISKNGACLCVRIYCDVTVAAVVMTSCTEVTSGLVDAEYVIKSVGSFSQLELTEHMSGHNNTNDFNDTNNKFE
eukprot:m.58941 g.58941  ORF g.58941 m.58941 type:complete len:340 (+) comp22628_c0_seq2:118-1137(+)